MKQLYSLQSYLFFLLLTFLFSACEKEEVNNTDKNYPIELTVIQEGRNAKLTWTSTNVSTFQNYFIIRSLDSIPDNFIPNPFNAIATVDEFDENTFMDENIPISDKIYYKVFVNIGNRLLISPTVLINYEIIILDVDPNVVRHDPEGDMLYFYDGFTQSIISYDYKQKNRVADIFVSLFGTPPMAIGDNGLGKEVYFSIGGDQLNIFDANTLELKTTYPLNDALEGITTNNNGLLILATDFWQAPIQVYDRSTNNKLNEFNFSSTSFRRIAMLNETTNEFIEVSSSEIHYYNITEDGTLETHFDVFFSGSLLPEIVVSPDGTHFIAHDQGFILNKQLELVATVEPPTFNNFNDFAFSSDGTRLFALQGFPVSLQEFSFPDLVLLNSTPLNYSPQRILNDDNQLIIIGTTGGGAFGLRTIVDIINL